MTNEQRTLKQLISEGMYVVDEPAIAGAIIARAQVNATVAHAGFRSHVTPAPVRTFRAAPLARSFRLTRHAGLQHP